EGKRRFHTKSFPTKGKADAWLTSQRHDKYQGAHVAPDKQTLGHYMETWLALKSSLAPKTHRTYSDFVKVHIKPDLGHIRLQGLTALDVQRWLNGKATKTAKSNPLASRTIKHLRDTLRN